MLPVITFAIGDIHGCQNALVDLLRQCRDYAQGRDHRFVFIGDYVDRGPHSRGVISTLRALERLAPDKVICLMGNHEDMLLNAVDSGDPRWWLGNGGSDTLLSYGVSDPATLPAADIAWVR